MLIGLMLHPLHSSLLLLTHRQDRSWLASAAESLGAIIHFRLPHGLTKGAWPARQTDQTDDPLDIGHEFQITGSTISSNESRGRGTSWEFASFQLQMYLARNANLCLDLLSLPRLKAERKIGAGKCE